MSNRPTDAPLAVQRAAEQGLPHPDLQVQVLPRHLRPDQDTPEDQRVETNPCRV